MRQRSGFSSTSLVSVQHTRPLSERGRIAGVYSYPKMPLTSECPQLILYSSHASTHDSVLAVGGLQPSECRVLAIPNSPTQLGEKIPNEGMGLDSTEASGHSESQEKLE